MECRDIKNQAFRPAPGTDPLAEKPLVETLPFQLATLNTGIKTLAT
jgi:hypothetical protein